MNFMDLSIVIPLFNEDESLPELHAWITRVVAEMKIAYEIILVDDGSKDDSWKVIEEIASKDKQVKGIRFRRNFGKSAGLFCGFEAAEGEVVITMDADMQDSPDEIPELYRMIREEKFDMVSGWKKRRYDPISKTIPSRFFNASARVFTGIKLHDFNCGLKAYRKELVKSIEVYGEMHRYIPVLAKQSGFTKIGEKIVQHRKRQYGVTKFGLERFVNGFLDLLSILFVTRFGKKPMHLFGTLGTIMFLIGFGIAFYLGAQKLYYLSQEIRAPLVASSPYFYISLAAMVIGTQLFLAGFLGELISRNSPFKNSYQIDRKLNLPE
jgi:glycosyltransferase involved in cell wall biosynthesis